MRPVDVVDERACHADGPAAASASNVVFVPRLSLDDATEAAKSRAEVLLYTEFRRVEQTAFWEVWVRRGVSVPALHISGRGGG